jgi:hypothetical protein
MKKIHLLLLAFLVLVQSMFGQIVSPEMSINVSVVRDANISGALVNLFTGLTNDPTKVVQNCGVSTFNVSDFDFVTLYKSEKTGEKEVAYSVKYLKSQKGTEISFAAYLNNGILTKPMLVKAKIDRSRIEYFDLIENKVAEIFKSNDIFVANSRDIDLGSKVAGRRSGCGQCVSDCISDAYTNKGWVSVWAFIQSIFIPSTGVGIAIGCSAKCCL